MPARNRVFFLGVYSPNEGEPDLSLELAILHWKRPRSLASPASSEHPEPEKRLPEMYVHSFLRPKYPARVRWVSAAEKGIEKDFILGNPKLPTVADLQGVNFLKGRRVVCFDPSQEPLHSLTAGSEVVESVSERWAKFFSDNEEALKCTSLREMLEYLGLPAQNTAPTRYTPLIQEVFATAAVWRFLEENGQSAQVHTTVAAPVSSPFWPLPETPLKWFEGEPKKLSDISKNELAKFFSGSIDNCLDWYHMNMYVSDWVFRRRKMPDTAYNDLEGQSDMAAFIFNQVLELKMQLWILIYYSIYAHKTDYAREIALHGGNLSQISRSARSNFAAFILLHLEDFLDYSQKILLMRSIVHGFLRQKARDPFEPYDFDQLYRDQKNNTTTAAGSSSRYYFKILGPENYRIACFKEITDSRFIARYRRYEISGHGSERSACAAFVEQMFRKLLQEVKDPFSCYWTSRELHNWIQYISGIAWSELAGRPKINENEVLVRLRHELHELILQESQPYVDALRRRLISDINTINRAPYQEFSDKFNFMGLSVEFVVTNKSQTPFLKRIFNFS